MKDNLNFYISTSQKCKYDELKLMIGLQIRVRLDLDLFDRIQILQGAMAICGAIFHARIPIGIRVVENPVDLRSLILHPWKHYSTNCSFGTADFKTEKRVRESQFRSNLPPHSLISTTISWHCPFKPVRCTFAHFCCRFVKNRKRYFWIEQ
jgi:hypothetical protein